MKVCHEIEQLKYWKEALLFEFLPESRFVAGKLYLVHNLKQVSYSSFQEHCYL